MSYQEQEPIPQNIVQAPSERGGLRWSWKNALKWGATGFLIGVVGSTLWMTQASLAQGHDMDYVTQLLLKEGPQTIIGLVGLLGLWLGLSQGLLRKS
ncbi:hypothetical protein HYW46_03845 [Candidatus Daviesbacteria bacterium]|nr:hypothetical protein [Candidatus Daviesbacteria bacterium]